jgi:hypothetical protein
MIIFLITSRRTLHPTSPTFLSVFGWFEHAFHSSATDLSLPNLINTIPPPSSSPKGKSSARLTAAKHANGPLDKAMRCLKRDSTPSECTDPIWLLRVQHSGYEPPPPPTQCHRPSLTVVPSLKAGILLPYLDLFDSNGCCHSRWERCALIIPNIIQKSRRISAARILCGFDVTLNPASLSRPPHSRPVTYRPRTQTG